MMTRVDAGVRSWAEVLDEGTNAEADDMKAAKSKIVRIIIVERSVGVCPLISQEDTT